MSEGWQVLTHGGAGSDPDLSDATDQAARTGLEELEAGEDPIDAACRAVARLEDDGRFNAGAGSNVRSDGSTVQMDAAVTDSRGRFGAVACIEQAANPVLVAREVARTDDRVLAGRGADRFARERGIAKLDPDEPRGSSGDAGSAADTVGCVLCDGDVFAAALSSGGTRQARVGRVGDVPLPGCGLRAGPLGAVAATGHGESIAMDRTADRAYALLADGIGPAAVVERVLDGFGEDLLGLIIVGPDGGAGGSNASMAYSKLPR